jgi:putative phage-type endonuclease
MRCKRERQGREGEKVMITEQTKIEKINYIGATECAAVLGLSRWDTPLGVWARKTGQIVGTQEESLAMWLGNELEDVVARRFMKETGKTVHRVNETQFHPAYPFIGCNLDRRVVGEDAILECKTASAWKSKEWEGEEIPQEYILQCYHQLAVTRKKVCYLAVLIGNQDFLWKEIKFDQKIIDDITMKLVHFWNDFVLTDIMPTTITKRDADTLDALFPQAYEGNEIKLEDDANVLIENLAAFKKDLKGLEGLIEQTENELKARIKDNEIGVTSLYRVAWTNSKWSGLDGKKLKEEMPEIHAQYYRSKPTRRFTYKPLKADR